MRVEESMKFDFFVFDGRSFADKRWEGLGVWRKKKGEQCSAFMTLSRETSGQVPHKVKSRGLEESLGRGKQSGEGDLRVKDGDVRRVDVGFSQRVEWWVGVVLYGRERQEKCRFGEPSRLWSEVRRKSRSGV